VPVPTRAMADEIARHGFDAAPLFIKVDTQGYEAQVFAGLMPYLLEHADWAVKTEFAPLWLDSQRADPVALLAELAGRFEVVEFPGRICWGTPSLEALFTAKIMPAQAEDFVAYVRNLNSQGRGWVDLLLRPRRA
jgi:hypothetical protein